MKRTVLLIATFLGVGYLPWAPGTWASLAALPLAWFFHETLIWQVIFFSIIGLLVCSPAETAFQAKDPHQFVIDEVAGMAISLLWLPRHWMIFAACFFLFRFLDVRKPGPIRLIQNSQTPSSIMWDDLAAGVAVNLILRLAVWAAVFFFNCTF